MCYLSKNLSWETKNQQKNQRELLKINLSYPSFSISFFKMFFPFNTVVMFIVFTVPYNRIIVYNRTILYKITARWFYLYLQVWPLEFLIIIYFCLVLKVLDIGRFSGWMCRKNEYELKYYFWIAPTSVNFIQMV